MPGQPGLQTGSSATSRALTAAAVAFPIVVILTAAVSLFYTPHDPLGMSVIDRLQGPSGAHLLGTDRFGADAHGREHASSQRRDNAEVDAIDWKRQAFSPGVTSLQCYAGLSS